MRLRTLFAIIAMSSAISFSCIGSARADNGADVGRADTQNKGSFAAQQTAASASASADTSSDAAPKTQNTESSVLQEVTVTAQRRSENLQTTPIAITAFTAGDLQNLGIQNAVELAGQTPGFSVRSDQSFKTQPSFTIRGLGQSQVNLQFQPSVATYIDGVYAATSSGAMVSGGFFDVDRVEVLKGPQGTLFGRNSTGGAISIVSKLPTDSLEGEIAGTAGSNGLKGVNAVVNLPLAPDVGFRIVGQYRRTSGYGEDLTSGRDLNNENLSATRVTFRAKQGPAEIVLRGEYSKSNTGAPSDRAANIVPGSPLVDETALQLGLAKSPADLTNPAVLAAALQAFTNLQAPGRYDARYGSGILPLDTAETFGGSATLSYDLSDAIQVKSISALRSNKLAEYIDADGTPIAVIQGEPTSESLHQFTEEVQLNGTALDDRLKFATGIFYYRVKGHDYTRAGVIPLLLPSSPFTFDGNTVDLSRSAYAQGTYTLFPRLRATGGIRYTSEHITLDAFNSAADPATGMLTVCAVPPEDQMPGAPCLGIFNNTFKNWSYTAGLDYQLSDLTLIYAKVSRGFKAGGENPDGQFNPVSFGPFKPEFATTYEVGTKSEFLDRRLRVDIAVYQTNFSDIQVTEIFAGSNGSFATRFANAATARIRGGELEVTSRPVDRVELSSGLSYINAGYTAFQLLNPATGGNTDHSHDPFVDVPKWKVNLLAAYTAPLEFGSLRFQVDANYQSRVVFDPADQTPLSNGGTNQDGYALVNGRLTLRTDRDTVALTGFVTNIFNRQYVIGGADLTGSIGYVQQFTGSPPRMWGFELSKRF
jgi:iron complex outermembrane recepter protein